MITGDWISTHGRYLKLSEKSGASLGLVITNGMVQKEFSRAKLSHDFLHSLMLLVRLSIMRSLLAAIERT